MGRPTGYDRSYIRTTSRSDCLVGVGFSTESGRITAFLVDLQYSADAVIDGFTQIARFDHNESTVHGHDVRREGLHLDVERRSDTKLRLWPAPDSIPRNLGLVVRQCLEYLIDNVDLFVQIYDGQRRPDSVPPWTI